MLVNLRGIGIVLGGRTILQDVEFQAKPGRLHGIIGPSGAGKSTLLAVIAGQINPDSADTIFRPAVHDVAWVVQMPTVLERRTAFDNVMLGALARGHTLATATGRAQEALAKVHLSHRSDVHTRKLSGGERQRVTVARAIATGAPVIIADEPTASLDANSRDQIVQCLRAAALAGATVIVATYDQYLADRCDDLTRLEPYEAS